MLSKAANSEKKTLKYSEPLKNSWIFIVAWLSYCLYYFKAQSQKWIESMM